MNAKGDLQDLRLGQCAAAELDPLQDRPEAALVRLGPLLDRVGVEEWGVTNLLPVLAEAQMRLEKQPEGVRRAEELAVKAVPRATRPGDRVGLLHAQRVRGLVLTPAAPLGRGPTGVGGGGIPGPPHAVPLWGGPRLV